MSWMNAIATCQIMHGDLISLRDGSIVPLIYQITSGNKRRRKRRQIAADKTIVWTSAHAIQLTNRKSSFLLYSSSVNQKEDNFLFSSGFISME